MHYGVGSVLGSWVDIYKSELLKASFGTDGKGEYDQVYNLSVPGGTTREVMSYMEPFVGSVNKIAPKLKTRIVISVGANNTKAVDTPDNYVSTPDEYIDDMRVIIDKARAISEEVIVVGFTPFDESKVNPKTNPLTGGLSYFTNSRLKLFEESLHRLCLDMDVKFVPLLQPATRAGWLDMLYVDGLHARSEAQNWLYDHLTSEGVLSRP